MGSVDYLMEAKTVGLNFGLSRASSRSRENRLSGYVQVIHTECSNRISGVPLSADILQLKV